MTEEEYFRKNYPDACYGDRPLSPYWDLFQDGVEFGERQSEQKIAELEKDKDYAEEQLDKQVEATLKLQEEYYDLKEINAILSESAAINQKDMEYKISVIKQRNKKIDELRKENAELKETIADIEKNFRICESNADTCYDQLAKAKDLIENIIRFTWGEGWNYSLDWKVKAEQFIKEIEK